MPCSTYSSAFSMIWSGSPMHGALYLLRVAADLLAPTVQDSALASGLLGVSEAVPDVGVLGHDAERYLLAATPDQTGISRVGVGFSFANLSSISGIAASRSRSLSGAVLKS